MHFNDDCLAKDIRQCVKLETEDVVFPPGFKL